MEMQIKAHVNWVQLEVIWYIFPILVCWYKEKSGNDGVEALAIERWVWWQVLVLRGCVILTDTKEG
jgi:hypothetical protein